MKEKIREVIVLTDEFDDQTGYGPWEYQDQIYKKITEYANNQCDGQGTDVIVQRESDGKYFKFTWILSFSQNYYFDDEMVEVFPKKITKTKYE